jgi:hypothetical protein
MFTVIKSLGILGNLSALCWIAAIVFWFRRPTRPFRTVQFWQALGLLLVAQWLGDARFVRVGRMRADQTQELAEAKERLERYQAQKKAQAAREAAEEAGEEDPDAVYEEAAAEELKPEARGYRSRGKVEREAGKTVKDATLKDMAGETTKVVESVRLVRSEDLHRMKHWSRLNRRWTVLLGWVAVAVILVDYLRRLNSTWGAYFPVPITGSWLDVLQAREFDVRLDPQSPQAMRERLELLLLKGETFVYFGAADPWSDSAQESPWYQVDRATALPRLVIPDPRPVVLRGWEWLNARRELRTRPWVKAVDTFLHGETTLEVLPLRKVVYRGVPDADVMDDTLESAWFRRYCFVVLPATEVDGWLDALQDFFRRRQHVLAAARRTVNIIWDMPDALDPGALEELQFLCEETHCRLIVVAPRSGS